MKSRTTTALILIGVCFCVGLATVLIGDRIAASSGTSILRIFPEREERSWFPGANSGRSTILFIGVDDLRRPDPILRSIWPMSIHPPVKDILLTGELAARIGVFRVGRLVFGVIARLAVKHGVRGNMHQRDTALVRMGRDQPGKLSIQQMGQGGIPFTPIQIGQGGTVNDRLRFDLIEKFGHRGGSHQIHLANVKALREERVGVDHPDHAVLLADLQSQI